MRPGRLLAALAVAAFVVVGAPRQAAAEPVAGDEPIAWRWRPFDTWEIPVAGVALGGASLLRAFGPTPSASWKGGILGDDWIQDHTAIQGLTARDRVSRMTDVFFFGAMAYRLVDSSILPAVVWGKPDVALQLSLIDLESFGFDALVLWGPQALWGRERPLAHRCSDPAFAAREGACPADASEHNRSFFAGHPAVVLTAAGLTCTHHAHLPLYGGGWPDKLACGLMIGAAVATGIGREVVEKHHASDVLVGFAVGTFSGFVMPEILHYGRARPQESAASSPPPLVRASLAPLLSPHELGLALHGSL
jgi:membrane-associated phospholipid phosphatase